MSRADELGPLDVAALMDALDRAHHIAVLECDDYEVLASEWAAVAEDLDG